MVDALVNKDAEIMLMDVYTAGDYAELISKKNLKIGKVMKVTIKFL